MRGGILAIFLAKINLSVSSIVRFIALFGIAVENGTVLVTFFNQLREQGMDAVEAVKNRFARACLHCRSGRPGLC